MKIYSWNMLFNNKELDRAFSFIRDTEWDVFCLQEVPNEFLARLETLTCSLAYRSGSEKVFPKKIVPLYNVILARHPIVARSDIPFPDYSNLLPLRTRLFLYLMRPLQFSKFRNRGSLYADVSVGSETIRLFNLHLILAQPLWRLKEFERAMAERDTKLPTIVCGDFNIVESLHVTPLNWFFGGRVSDTLLFRRERTHIEKRFIEHELLNVFRGTITHPFSRSQLDHILVSKHFSVNKTEVLSDRMGSDHCPIRVEVA